MSEKSDSRQGFTLIELMITIAIIGILAAVAFPAMSSARRSSNEAAAIHALRAIQGAMTMYRMRFASYPDVSELDEAGFLDGFVDDPGGGVTKRNYLFIQNWTPGTNQRSYRIRANPATPGVDGDRFFAIYTDGVIRWSSSGPVVEADPPID